jgi:hypothetical protein
MNNNNINKKKKKKTAREPSQPDFLVTLDPPHDIHPSMQNQRENKVLGCKKKKKTKEKKDKPSWTTNPATISRIPTIIDLPRYHKPPLPAA